MYLAIETLQSIKTLVFTLLYTPNSPNHAKNSRVHVLSSIHSKEKITSQLGEDFVFEHTELILLSRSQEYTKKKLNCDTLVGMY